MASVTQIIKKGLLKEQIELEAYCVSDGKNRCRIKPIEDVLSFDKVIIIIITL